MDTAINETKNNANIFVISINCKKQKHYYLGRDYSLRCSVCIPNNEKLSFHSAKSQPSLQGHTLSFMTSIRLTAVVRSRSVFIHARITSCWVEQKLFSLSWKTASKKICYHHLPTTDSDFSEIFTFSNKGLVMQIPLLIDPHRSLLRFDVSCKQLRLGWQ